MKSGERSKPSRILVIGYGNPGRMDDGLGPAAAARISGLGLPCVSTADPYQLSIEDSIDVAAHDFVWFVDSSKSSVEPFEKLGVKPVANITFDSHSLTPETLLAITARYLDAMPEASMIAIRGYEFNLGEALSPAARNNLEQAIEYLGDEIRAQIGGQR